ncbi:MAG: sugar ABC transporter ATP-binding protein [Planctomycetes bacterium]|nr:sugar ABC transporter ATP-binding protein [Planctomycetota bacterium]
MAQRIVESPGPKPRLQMQGISKRFGATVALNDVGLQVFPGEVLALVGENGAGKSTLMKILSGAHKSDAGRMWLNQQKFKPTDPMHARKSGVAMIYQELSLAPHLSVEDNIMLGMEPKTFGFVRFKKVRQRAGDALRQFAHADIHPETLVKELSVAARQLVEIARALAVGCSVLILDEPTSSLTQKDVQQLFALIKQLRNQGLAIVYISHFLEEIRQVADRVSILRDGKTVGEDNLKDITNDEIIALMVGRQVKDLYPRSPRTAGEVALEVKNLSGITKPLSANLTLHRGEVLGIAGLMGAGRTELIRCIFGLDPVRRGKIKIGIFTGPASPVRRWLQNVGMLSEDRKEQGLALSLTIADNVTLSRMKGFGPCGLTLPHRQAQAAQRWIEKLDIRCRGPHQKVLDLSGGNQQKIALARLLQHDADVLLLDEPTRGIDVAAKVTIYKIINELASTQPGGNRPPKAILLVSSYLPELLGICDRIAVMCRSRLGPAQNVDDVNEHSLMALAAGQEKIA